MFIFKRIFPIITLLTFFLTPVHATVSRIGVIPFENLVQKSDMDWGRWVSSSISTKFAKVEKIQMVERVELDSILEELARGNTGLISEDTILQVGEQLSADHMITGEIQGTEKEVTIYARVIEVESGHILTGEEVRGDWEDIFELQDELALKILDRLGFKLTELEKHDIAEIAIDNLKDYEWFDKGNNESDRELALKYYNNTISLNPNFAEAYHNIGNIYYDRGELEKAEFYFRKVLNINPDYPTALYNMACIFEARKEYSKACEYYEKILHNPDFALDAYLSIGVIYSLQDDLDRSEEYFRKSVEYSPKNYLGNYNLGVIYYEKGKLDEAIPQLLKASRINGGDCEVYYYLGEAYSGKEVFEKAEEYYLMALDLAPEYLDARAALGKVYIKQARYNKAINLFNDILNGHPDCLNAIKSLGDAYWHLGKYNYAIDLYKKYLLKEPDDWEVIFFLGKAYEVKGEDLLAEEKYKRVLELKPGHKDSIEAINSIEIKRFENYMFLLVVILFFLSFVLIITMGLIFVIVRFYMKKKDVS